MFLFILPDFLLQSGFEFFPFDIVASSKLQHPGRVSDVTSIPSDSLWTMDREAVLAEIVEQYQQLKTDLRFAEFIDPCYDSGFNPTDRDFGDATSLNEALQDFTPEILASLAESLCQLLTFSPSQEERNNDRNRERNVLEVLDEAAGISDALSVKEFIAALAFCVLTGLKAKENNGIAARGGVAASVFLLLCTATNGSVPARLHQTLGVSSFYIKHMFSKSIDMLSLPDLWESQKYVGSKKGPKGRAQLQERTLLNVDEDMELVVQTGVQWEESECMLLKALVLFARNVDLDAFPYHLARPCRAVAGVWKRGFETFQPTLDDSLDVSDVLKRSARKELVGKFFSLVLSKTQKSYTDNLEVVLWSFEPGFLRLTDALGTYAAAPPKKVQEFSNNVTALCLRIVQKFADDEACDDVLERFMHDVFTNTPDMAEYRRYSAKLFVSFLSVLKPALRQNVIQWLAEESDADRAKGRALALCVAQELWAKDWNHVEVPYFKCNNLKPAILEMCIRRLRDKSSKIRGCAASVMSFLLESDGTVFDHLRNDKNTREKDQQSVRTLFTTVLAGIADVSVVSRKAYLLMVGRLLVSDFRLFDIDVKEAVLRVAQDPAKSMRTSNIDVICDIARAQTTAVAQVDDHTEAVGDLWLRGVFHCYMDPEQTIKARVIEAFASTILNPVLTSSQNDNVLAWSLLDKICKDELGEIRLLRQIFHDMEKAKTLTTAAYNKFRGYLDGPHQQTAWVVLAELSAILSKSETEFAFDFLDNLPFEGQDDVWGASLFRIIQAGFKSKSLKKAGERLQELKDYFPKIRGVATVVEAVRAIAAGFEALGEKQQHGKHDDFADWADEHLHDCTRQLREELASYGDWLNRHRLAPKEPDVKEEATPQEIDVCFCVRLVSELGCHLGVGKPKNRATKAVVGDESPESLIERVCDFDSTLQCRSWVRAHGVFALGRLCLGVKQLSWKYAPKIVGMANSHTNDIGLRRDAIVVVFDMLKMFGDVIEKDLFKVYGWLGDPNSTIRGDVINHLHNLLLNEHLQWNPAVFYQFLTSISDPNPKIREWVRSCLRSLMKKRNQCFSDFSEAIIFLNACHSHPRFKVAAKLNNQGVEFALVGNDFADKRMEIYTFMLKQMVDDQKRITYARILEQILMPVVTRDVQIEANEAYRNVPRDVFRILGLKEMQFSVFIKNTEEEEEELEEQEENVDVDQVEEENQRKAEKQNKAQRKELWIKFRQEIVQRTLLPVLSSVYRQLKYMQDDQELLQAEIRLVDYLAKSAEINLAELAQSTSGTDGQILKSLAMDIQRLEEQTRASVPPTPSTSAPPSRADDIPLVSSQIMSSSDVQTPAATPLPTNGTAKKAKKKADRTESVEDTPSEASEEPPSRKRAARAPAVKINKSRKVVEEEHDKEVKEEEVTTVLATRQSRRIKDKSDVLMPFAERNTSENGKRPSTSPPEESDDAPPRKKKDNTRRGTKRPGKSTVIKEEEDLQSSPEIEPRRTTRVTAVQQAPVVEEESFGEGDDTLVDLQNGSRPRRTTGPRNGNVTMSRGVSTPIKSRNGNMADLTFGADLSVIDPSEVTQRVIRSATKSKKGKK